MKIVAVSGSQRRGNTFAMVDAACRALEGRCEVTMIDLRKFNIQPCSGCLKCDTTATCRIQDSMADILPEVAGADAFIFGTPARWSILSGELKVFFDRLYPLPEKALKGKKAVIFAVGHDSQDNGGSIQRTRDSVAHCCDNIGIDVIDSVLAYGCLHSSDARKKTPEILQKCAEAANNLCRVLTETYKRPLGDAQNQPVATAQNQLQP
jgi:multimeric flavodoxin WrbA